MKKVIVLAILWCVALPVIGWADGASNLPEWADFQICFSPKAIHGLNLSSILPPNPEVDAKLQEMSVGAGFDYFRNVSFVRVLGTIPRSHEESKGLVIHQGSFTERRMTDFLKGKLGDPEKEEYLGVTLYKEKGGRKGLAFFGSEVMILGYVPFLKSLIVRRHLAYAPAHDLFQSGVNSGTEVFSASILHARQLIMALFDLFKPKRS